VLDAGYRKYRGVLIASLVAGFAIGALYDCLFLRQLGLGLRGVLITGIYGVVIAATCWASLVVLAGGPNSKFGRALRRLPPIIEMGLRALVVAASVAMVGFVLLLLLYPTPHGLRPVVEGWLRDDLWRILTVTFAVSLMVRLGVELHQLIGGELILSALFGTYKRPVRRELVVMFLDIANSTGIAESLGEQRVHDFVTRFFRDIDPTIRAFGGRVHEYVGDAALVVWPLSAAPARNARSVACVFAIESQLAMIRPEYLAEFGFPPQFRAALHAGPILASECGESRRQLAYFGDTMNVAGRLSAYGKSADKKLVVSADCLRRLALPSGIAATDAKRIKIRGRGQAVEVYAIRAGAPEETTEGRSSVRAAHAL
jgi:class 3 adenylate cyclase